MKRTTFVVALILACLVAPSMPLALSARTAPPEKVAADPSQFGYGFSQIPTDGSHAYQLGFNWIQSYYPPKAPQATKVLYRIQVRASDLNDLNAFSSQLSAIASLYGDYIDAYEIGNEVNLASEWGAPPVAADYAYLLDRAQAVLRQADPGALIVSAGLSTVGRVSTTWAGHAGHNGQVQDEREYLKEFIDNNGHQYADVIGYHPMGFRADYSATPDVDGGTPETDCGNGLCFRSAEKIYEILLAKGVANPRIWATEVGWIVMPPDECRTDPSWAGRLWQSVTPEKQAENLTGAFSYARLHWPWMEAMFVFNLDIDKIPYYSACEQMRYYSVSGRPAEAALLKMPKTAHRIFLPVIVGSAGRGTPPR